MNKAEIEDQFDRLCRTEGLTGYEELKNSWIAIAHSILTTEFAIPSYKITWYSYTVADQERYILPYVYDGTEVALWYDGTLTGETCRRGKRLDPYPEEMLELSRDRRSRSGGPVELYDWSQIVDDCLLDLCGQAGVVITNRSPIVTCAAAPFVAATHENEWCRFGPWDDADGVEQNPGDFGYLIDTVNAAGTVTLAEAYRGPSSTAGNPARMQVRPKETQMVRLYGVPTEDDRLLQMEIYRSPRRLYNSEDVPEWPRLGTPIAFVAVAVGLRHLQRYDEAQVFMQEGFNLLGGVKRRRRRTEMLTPDVPQGRIIGRRTGLPSFSTTRYRGLR